MKLNKKLEVGINAVSALKKFDKPVRITDIVGQCDTTPNFLAQVMRNLRTAKIVIVKRGPGGGYTLNRDFSITAFHVASAVGRTFPTASLDSDPASRLNKAVTDAFLNTTI